MSDAHDHDLDLEQLFEQHYDFLWRMAQRLGVPQDSVEDVLQETFLAAHKRRLTFEGRAQPHVWLCSFLVNIHRNFDRKQRRGARKHSNYCDASLARAEFVQRQSTFSAQYSLALGRLEDFLAALDADKRAVFVLAEIEGMTGREIADSLDINVNTAHARLRAARAEFCQHFGEDAYASFARRSCAARKQPERAPPESRARTRALLIAGLGGPRPGRGWLAGAPAAVSKQAVLGVVSLCVTTLAFVPVVASTRPTQPDGDLRTLVDTGGVLERSGSLTDTGEPLEPRVEAPIAEPEPITVAAPRRTARAARDVESAPPVSTEYLVFTRARQALVAGHFEQALATIEQLSSTGPLAGQRARMQSDALCGLGRNDEARGVAAAWNAGHGDEQIAPICW